MQPISDVISQIIKDRQLDQNSDSLAKKAISNSQVQDFLNQNRDRIDNAMIKASLANIFTFVDQIEHPNSVIKGYQPQLFINGRVIDIRFAPTQQKIKAQELAQRKHRIELIDLPEKLRNVDLTSIDRNPERRESLVEIANFIKNYKKDHHAKGLYLEGDFGVGKTYILAALANAIASEGSNVIFLHVPSFIAGLSSHFQDNSLNQEIDRIANAPVLIFDDIGAESLSEWSRDDVLSVILQKRMDNDLPTFFSSNMDMNALEQHLAETKNSLDEVKAKRLMQRVRYLSREVFVGGQNRRF